VFLLLHKQGLVTQAPGWVNWDPVDRTVLANEQVDDQGRSWRSGALVEKKQLDQWYLRITRYAEQLLAGLDSLPLWPEQVKRMQRAWIGRSTGTLVTFNIVSSAPSPPSPIVVFTTRVETIFGISPPNSTTESPH